MDFLSEKKYMKWIIVILILLNLATISFLWINRLKGPGNRELIIPDKPPKEKLAEFLTAELELTESQATKITSLREDHFKSVDKILQKIHANKKNLMDNLFEGTETTEMASLLTKKIGELQSELELLTFNHFLEMKQILGPNQKDNLKELIGGFFRNHPQNSKGRPHPIPPPPPK